MIRNRTHLLSVILVCSAIVACTGIEPQVEQASNSIQNSTSTPELASTPLSIDMTASTATMDASPELEAEEQSIDSEKGLNIIDYGEAEQVEIMSQELLDVAVDAVKIEGGKAFNAAGEMVAIWLDEKWSVAVPESTTESEPILTLAAADTEVFSDRNLPYPKPEQDYFEPISYSEDRPYYFDRPINGDVPLELFYMSGETEEAREQFKTEINNYITALRSAVPSSADRLIYFVAELDNGVKTWGAVATDFNRGAWLPTLLSENGEEEPLLSLSSSIASVNPDSIEIGATRIGFPEEFGPSARLGLARSGSGWPVLAILVSDEIGMERVAAWYYYQHGEWALSRGFLETGQENVGISLTGLNWEHIGGKWLGQDGPTYVAILEDGQFKLLDELAITEENQLLIYDVLTGEFSQSGIVPANSEIVWDDESGEAWIIDDTGKVLMEYERYLGSMISKLSPYEAAFRPANRMYYRSNPKEPAQLVPYGFHNPRDFGMHSPRPEGYSEAPEKIKELVFSGVLIDEAYVINVKDDQGQPVVTSEGEEVEALVLPIGIPDNNSGSVHTVNIIEYTLPYFYYGPQVWLRPVRLGGTGFHEITERDEVQRHPLKKAQTVTLSTGEKEEKEAALDLINRQIGRQFVFRIAVDKNGGLEDIVALLKDAAEKYRLECDDKTFEWEGQLENCYARAEVLLMRADDVENSAEAFNRLVTGGFGAIEGEEMTLFITKLFMPYGQARPPKEE